MQQSTRLTNHGDKTWNPRQSGRASWFSHHVPEGCGRFEQFRNGYMTSVCIECIPQSHYMFYVSVYVRVLQVYLRLTLHKIPLLPYGSVGVDHIKV